MNMNSADLFPLTVPVIVPVPQFSQKPTSQKPKPSPCTKKETPVYAPGK